MANELLKMDYIFYSYLDQKMNPIHVSVSFVAGVLFMAFATATAMCCLKQEPEEDVSSLFTKRKAETEEEPDEFKAFIVERMSTSQSFRIKVVAGLVRLYNTDRNAYVNMMRAQ